MSDMKWPVLVVLGILLGGLTAEGQKVRYKDLFPLMGAMTNPELKNALKEYITEDADHPNANFRLALVYEANYKSADPLTQYDYALANAEQAKLRFLKSKQLVDDREVSRNNEYYFPIFRMFDAKGRPNVEFMVVSKKINAGYDSAQLFLEKIPPIYQAFTSSVNFYDKAVKEFARANDNFLSLDDLYLFFDNNTEKQLTQLKQDFDSAKIYMDKYIQLTKAFPIFGHEKKYHIKPILTYRLDGLITRMNFLTNDVELWDYSTWVDQMKKSVNTDIVSLRTKLMHNEEKLDETIANIQAAHGQGIVPYKLDKQLVFNLNNYDKQSLVLALLDYKAFKQGWLIKSNTLKPDTVDAMRNAEMFSTLIYSNRSADTLIEQVKSRLLTDKIRKHHVFFEKYYGTAEGLKKYASDEKEYVQSTLNQYASGLKTALITIAASTTTTEMEKVVKFGKWSIPYSVGAITPELLTKGDPITLQNRKNPDGSIYLTGIYTIDKKINNLVTYVARVNPDGKPAWIRNFDFKSDSLSKVPDANNSPGPLVLTQEGCVLVVRSVPLLNASAFNTLVYINEKGDEKFKIKLKEGSFPRKLTYVEKSNAFIVLLRGTEEKQDYRVAEPVTLLGINALGDTMWRRNIDLAGHITELVHVIDGYLVIGNYSMIRDLTGKEFQIKAGNGACSPYIIKLNEKGEVTKVHPVISTKSIYVTHVIKVNDTSINLLGSEATFDSPGSLNNTPADKIVHIMVNQFSDTVFTDF